MLAIPTLSRASPAPTGFEVYKRLVINTAPVWERACSRKRCVRQRDAGYTDAFAGKPGSHRFCGVQKAGDQHAPMWERACSRNRCVRQRDAGYTDAFAGKPGSHRFCGVHKAGDQHSSSVGASLLAKAVCQAIEMLAIPTPSRASPAPTGFAVCTRLVINTAPVWERACSRKRCVRQRDAGYTDAFAGKPGSHRFCGVQKACDHHQSSVGAGLLAKATGQAPSSVRRTLSSSSLIWNGLTSISMPLPRNTWRLIAVSA